MSPLQLFKCLSDDTRLKSVYIIQALEEVCVCDLMTALDLEQPKVSRHLAELRKCGVLQDERRGKWVYYRLHANLPDWATELISLSAAKNTPYFSEALAKLHTAQQASDSLCC
ncbi:metalloregulator ArsR/SmtB family transcription factor [Aestuariibacter salexigens]|uniref:metalloregulator ArsR/SmtB family transcription factor n=1 Tax=Aestuariibacter salexigens TaxID=226010 RepID=UPI0004285E1D|nr:metalloregulator ArsR/SmtB family transcription factor [Aestuariibacter salexigens]